MKSKMVILLVLYMMFFLADVGAEKCSPPVGCAYCHEWDYHGDKTLFEASCNYPTLTAIPTTFPSTLGKLRASYNRITNLTRSSFAGYPYLKWLSVENNFMEVIENGTFLRQALLDELYLGYNKLERITRGTLEGLRDLQRLRLSKNTITRLYKGAFESLHMLTVLELADNEIEFIDVGAFGGLFSLRTLFLGGNLIKFFSSSTLGNLPSLTLFDISFNKIEEIEEGSFLELPNLSTLHMNDCKIRKIPAREPFKGLRKLKELDISTNPLNFIPADSFHEMKGLSSLNMTNMNISVLHNGTFNVFDSLSALYINGNPLMCDCGLKWMKEWLVQARNASGTKLHSANSTKCHYPSELAGQIFDRVNESHFVCSCESCTMNDACEQYNTSSCTCNAHWQGQICDTVCNAKKRGKTCTSFGALCYCSYPLRAPTVVCHANAVTLNGSDGMRCQCRLGFTGNGTQCIDINECLLDPGCHASAECKNSPGFYECICKAGYEGNGKECYPVLPPPKQIKVSLYNETAVHVTWFINSTSELTKCILVWKEVGGKAWKERVQRLQQWNKTVLGNLEPDTTYLLKFILVNVYNSRSPVSEVTEFRTSDNPEDQGRGELGSSGSSKAALTASLSTVAVLFVVLLIVLVALYYWRERRKQKATRHFVEVSMSELVNAQMAYENPAQTDPAVPLDEWEIPRDRVVLKDKLGEGEFGIVMEGELLIEEEAPRKVAIKMLKSDADRTDHKDMLRELDMFKGIGQHENVVSLIGACTLGMPLYIITEFIAGGTLLELLRESRCITSSYVNANLVSKLSGKDLLKLALGAARGMRHISGNRFVHRDLATRNVLVTEDLTAKITDFGLSRDIYSDGIYLNAKGGKLPLKWMAPESLLDYVYTTQSDIWSFGVLMWEVWSFGAMPYSAVVPNELLSMLMSGFRLSRPPLCPEEIYDVMMSCWNAEPEVRPSFAKLCTVLESLYDETPQVLAVQITAQSSATQAHLLSGQ